MSFYNASANLNFFLESVEVFIAISTVLSEIQGGPGWITSLPVISVRKASYSKHVLSAVN